LWLPRYYFLFKWVKFEKKDVVLDASCGEGDVTAQLNKIGCAAIGIDRSLGIINHRFLTGKREVAEKPSFVLCDLLRLAFADNVFDKIVSLETVQEIEDDREFFREMSRVLKPGGRLIVELSASIYCEKTLFKVQKFFRRIIPKALRSNALPLEKPWWELSEEEAKKRIRYHRTYTLEQLLEKSQPYFSYSRHAYAIKPFAALTMDVTYGIKGLWFLRPFLFYLSTRLDYILCKRCEGYALFIELKKKD
jgi:ubiquinone/menaquinone biosynthesis C-methylase UbiE